MRTEGDIREKLKTITRKFENFRGNIKEGSRADRMSEKIYLLEISTLEWVLNEGKK